MIIVINKIINNRTTLKIIDSDIKINNPPVRKKNVMYEFNASCSLSFLEYNKAGALSTIIFLLNLSIKS
jgi:hypothetical protein